MRSRNEMMPPADAGPVERTVRPLVDRLRGGVWGTNRIPLCAEAADEIERLRKKVQAFDALYPELGQLIQGCKQDWASQGSWSDWDQSVQDRLQALAALKA